jgi:predicted transposase YbfD/YdcC
VFRLLDPAELARAFPAFMAALRAELGLGPARGVVAVDAKSLRRGYDKGRAHMAPLMVSVWDTQTRLSIAQGRAPGNGEVKARLALLKGLVLKGCTVTADALHGHAEMARAVRAAKAHYCLGLKGNRGPLFAAVEAAFAEAGPSLPFHETTETGHGRQERRRASLLPARALGAELGRSLQSLQPLRLHGGCQPALLHRSQQRHGHRAVSHQRQQHAPRHSYHQEHRAGQPEPVRARDRSPDRRPRQRPVPV